MTPEKFENLGFRGGIGADEPQAAAGDLSAEAVKEKTEKKEGFLGAIFTAFVRRFVPHFLAAFLATFWPPFFLTGRFRINMAQLAHGMHGGEAREAHHSRVRGSPYDASASFTEKDLKTHSPG